MQVMDEQMDSLMKQANDVGTLVDGQLKIAIIDDGVNSSYYPSIGALCFDVKVNKSNKIVKRIGHDKAITSHGTTCAAIIKKYAPNAVIGSIKVLSDDTLRGKANHLITALEWCFQNDIKLIHMSIGSREVKDIVPIKNAISNLLSKGCIVVAALANTMKFSVPACLDGVFGVKTSAILEKDQYYVNEGGLYDMQFIASSKHLLVDNIGEEHITPLCNSYAAPLITSQIHNLLESKPFISESQIRGKLGLAKMSTYQELLFKTPLISQEIDIPIICITGETKKVLSCVSELNQLFLNAGYPCKAFYDGNQVCSSNIEWIPPSVPVENLIAFHANQLQLGVILLASENSELVERISDAHIHLSIDGMRNRYNGDDITIPQSYTTEHLKRVVIYIGKIGS